MDRNAFEEPVSIVVGLGYPAQVETVAEAYALLSEWPHGQRDTAYRVALKACRAALDGKVEAETARGPFVAFARKNGLLMPEREDVVAARATGAFAEALPS